MGEAGRAHTPTASSEPTEPICRPGLGWSRLAGVASGGASRRGGGGGVPGAMLVFAAARLTQDSACEQSRQDGEGLRTFLYVFYTTMNKSESKLCWAAEAANPQQGWGRGRGVAGSDPRRKAGQTRPQAGQAAARIPPPSPGVWGRRWRSCPWTDREGRHTRNSGKSGRWGPCLGNACDKTA